MVIDIAISLPERTPRCRNPAGKPYRASLLRRVTSKISVDYGASEVGVLAAGDPRQLPAGAAGRENHS